MRKLWGILGVLLLAFGLFALGQPAHGDGENRKFSKYAVTAMPARDGSIAVTVDVDLDFGSDRGRGPTFTLPTRLIDPTDSRRYRLFTYRDFAATSSTGAPTRINRESNDSTIKLRIGRENTFVTGVQSYRLTFTMSGVINPNVNGQDEFGWNVIDNFDIPVENLTVNVEMPAGITRSECHFGAPKSAGQPCSKQGSDNRVTWTVPRVDVGDGVTVTAAVPAGTFSGVQPQYEDRVGIDTVLAVTPVTAGVGSAVVLLGVGAVIGLTRRAGRDERYVGLTPGLRPVGADAATTTAGGKVPVAVQFTPPAGALPGQIGTLMDERVGMGDISATMVDLAVRGYLRIEEVPEDNNDKRIVRLRDNEGLLPYEATFVSGLFGERDSIRLSKTTTMTNTVTQTQSALYRDVTESGWFRRNPSTVRWVWLSYGALVTVFGAGVAVVLGLTFGLGLIGVAIAVVGLALAVAANWMPARSAEGSAVLAQAKGFELYLRTAEADQLRFEEGENIFSRYLPWALAFGVAERWTQLCAELVNQGRADFDTSWYVGSTPIWYAPSIFAASMSSIGSSISAAAFSSGSSVGGGSSFGGGVGGGVGGMSGGSW